MESLILNYLENMKIYDFLTTLYIESIPIQLNLVRYDFS